MLAVLRCGFGTGATSQLRSSTSARTVRFARVNTGVLPSRAQPIHARAKGNHESMPQRARTPRVRVAEPSEKVIQAAICDYLSWKGYCFAITDRSRHWGKDGRVRPSRISMPGYPDISLVVNSKAVFIEVKSAKGRLSPEQRECHDTLRRNGATVFVARSVDEVIASLAGL